MDHDPQHSISEEVRNAVSNEWKWLAAGLLCGLSLSAVVTMREPGPGIAEMDPPKKVEPNGDRKPASAGQGLGHQEFDAKAPSQAPTQGREGGIER